MHTEAQLRRAAANAGCRVLSIRYMDTPAGKVLCARFEGPDNEAAFRLLTEFALDDVGDPVGRTVGLEIRQRYGPDQVRMAKAIQQWVKDNVTYIPEPSETFQAPWYTVKVGVGDCDDHANLVHSIARNAGLKARVIPVRNSRGTISHACTQINVDGVWSWSETTLDAGFDEEPRSAAARLGVLRSDISGMEGQAMEATTVVLKGTIIPVRTDVRYRARARVDTARVFTPTSTIRTLFEDIGFSRVQVWTEKAELPADWPEDQKDDAGGGFLGGWVVFIEGTWAMPAQSLTRPEPLIAVWEADQPAPATGPGSVRLPEIVIVGQVPRHVDWRVAAFLLGTSIAVLGTALAFGKPIH